MSPDPMRRGSGSPGPQTAAGTPCRIVFEGRDIPARTGQSVASALVAAGITSWRTTRAAGRPRGLFCGIGVCYDCLISVDGLPTQRACLVPVTDGMRLGPDPAGEPAPRPIG